MRANVNVHMTNLSPSLLLAKENHCEHAIFPHKSESFTATLRLFGIRVHGSTFLLFSITGTLHHKCHPLLFLTNLFVVTEVFALYYLTAPELASPLLICLFIITTVVIIVYIYSEFSKYQAHFKALYICLCHWILTTALYWKLLLCSLHTLENLRLKGWVYSSVVESVHVRL